MPPPPPLPPFQSPVACRHAEPSMLLSADDDSSGPSPRLIELALAAAGAAQRIDLSDLSRRMPAPPYYADVWPGEHYKLLAALVQVLQPKLVVELGTATGLSALALRKHLPAEGRVATFDVGAWQEYPETVLAPADFADGRLVQYVDDLSRPEVAERHAALLAEADLIFIDALKDGVMERRFLANFERVAFRRPPLLVFDDIRLWNMLAIWREIARPKLDLTSFGHWSGTGLVEWR